MSTITHKIMSFGAAVMLAVVLSINPANAQNSGLYGDVSNALVEEGNGALAAEEYNTALIKYEQGLVANPQNIEAYVGLGRLYFEVKSYPLSLKYFDIALTMQPTSMRILELSAYSHLATYDWDAVDEIRQKMEIICIAGSCEELDRLKEALIEDEASVVTESDNM